MGRAAEARAYWRGRARRDVDRSGRGYTVYLSVLVSLVVGAPAVFAAWTLLRSDPVSHALRSSSGVTIVSTTVLALWIVALALGRVRGPVVLPGFLAYAMGSSPLSRWQVFGVVAVRAILLVAVVTGTVGAAAYMSLAGFAEWTAGSLIVFAAASLATGVIAGVLWLTAEVHPKAPAMIGVAATIAGAAALAWPGLLHVLPWGWAGWLWGGGPAALIAPLGVLAIAAVVLIPVIVRRLSTEQVVWQGRAWSVAAEHTATFDFSSIAELYRARPSWLRGVDAVVPQISMALTILRRDVVGAFRTPGRLAAGLLQIAIGAAAFVIWGASPLGCVAGALLMSAGCGAMTDGLRHATDVVSSTGTQLYGMSDARLVGLHALFPGVVVFLFALAGASPLLVGGEGMRAFGLVLLPPLLLGIAAARMLRGDLPIALLAPIDSPFGDMGAMARMLWSLERPLLVAVAGATVAGLPASLWGLAVLYLVVVSLLVRRWRRRR